MDEVNKAIDTILDSTVLYLKPYWLAYVNSIREIIKYNVNHWKDHKKVYIYQYNEKTEEEKLQSKAQYDYDRQRTFFMSLTSEIEHIISCGKGYVRSDEELIWEEITIYLPKEMVKTIIDTYESFIKNMNKIHITIDSCIIGPHSDTNELRIYFIPKNGFLTDNYAIKYILEKLSCKEDYMYVEDC